jgi:hypothetical protein
MTMHACAKSVVAQTRSSLGIGTVCVILLSFLSNIPRAQAGATLFLEEPYSYDGAFSGTGHSAVYLSNVCASSPIVLRPCAPGETGVVLSRYNGVAGYDWVAIPLIPYLYAVDQLESVPLFDDAKVIAFLRDQYRRTHLESLAPDSSDGGTPEGNWYELVGASYDRTIYGFEVETTPEQDAALIKKLNSQPNRQHYNVVRRNCADFAREIINSYYPRAAHRSIIGDLGVTTPKQVAKMLVKYERHHPELQTSDFVIPQVPGNVRRSKPIHGVLESVVAAKKYMLPLFALHPYIAGSLLAGYFGHGRFDPAKNDMVLDSRRELSAPMSHSDRRSYESRLDELSRSGPADSSSSEKGIQAKEWERSLAGGEPKLDSSGKPVLQVREGGEESQVGISRANILNVPESSELAAQLLVARIHEELRSGAERKTARSDVDDDFLLLRQILSIQRKGLASNVSSSNEGVQAIGTLQ